MYNEPKRDLFLLLIISTLLHLIVVIIILLSKIDDSIKTYKETLLKSKGKKARVIFQQPAEKKQKPKKTMAHIPAAGTAASSGTLLPAQPPQRQEPRAPALPKPIKPKQQEPKKELEPKDDPKKLEKKQKLLQRQKETKKILKKLEPEGKITKIIQQKKEESASKNKFQKQLSTTQKIVKKTPPKKKLTLADLAKGFMNYARVNIPVPPSDSNHMITVLGAQTGKATEEQLRYERYATKLFKCIQSSLKILLRGFHFIQRPDVEELSLDFLMDVSSKGNISCLTIRRGTGNQQFDALMINVLHHASKSFPPLPSYFQTEVCTFPIIYTIQITGIK